MPFLNLWNSIHDSRYTWAVSILQTTLPSCRSAPFYLSWETFLSPMKKNILLSLLLALAALPMAGFGQSFILFEEDFENTPSSFTLNTDGIAGAPIGTNTWIINDEYDGFPLYPETPNQDSVLSGTIGGAPFSNYLHIHDANSFPGVANANYDPSNASDNFVELTLSLIHI